MVQTFQLHRWWLSLVATCTGVFFPAPTSADSPLVHVVVHPQQLALVVLYHPANGANTALAQSGNVHCVVVVCGGIYNIHIFYSSICIVMYIQYICVANPNYGRGLSEQNILAFIKVVVVKGVIQTMDGL